MVRLLVRGDKVEGEDGEAVVSALGSDALHRAPISLHVFSVGPSQSHLSLTAKAETRELGQTP